jgi:hypothetical protein
VDLRAVVLLVRLCGCFWEGLSEGFLVGAVTSCVDPSLEQLSS